MSDEEQNKADENETDNKYQDEEDEKDDETRIAEEKAAREAAKKRCYKFSDPPKIFSDIKVSFTKYLHDGLIFFICLTID